MPGSGTLAATACEAATSLVTLGVKLIVSCTHTVILCVWFLPQVAKVVAPKKAKLAEAEASYQEVMVGLTAKQQELQVGRKQPGCPGVSCRR